VGLSQSRNRIEKVKSILPQKKKSSLSWRAFSFLVLLGVAILVLGLDQLTKVWVSVSLPEGGWWSPLPGLWRVFRITHITNSGAAFGIFPNQGNFFIFIAVIVALAIVFYYRHLPTEGWLIRLSLGLQLGGAVGNLLDRLRYGHVVDFIDIGFWPIFNVADASIVTGVAILAYYLWREEQTAATPALNPTDEAPRMGHEAPRMGHGERKL
jgi:signal peptidase II